MLFPSQQSMQSFTCRSIYARNSHQTISDGTSSHQVIQQPRLQQLIKLPPQQQQKSRQSFRHSFMKHPQHSSHSNSKLKPCFESKDNDPPEEIDRIQNYLGSHNKFKTYFKSRAYKKIYQELACQLPLEKSYFSLYMLDKFYALNKHLKVSLVRKQSFQEYLGPYFDAGKTLIKDFYRYFLVDDELCKATKKVDTAHVSNCAFGKSSNLCHFFYLTVTFLYQLAVFYRSRNQRLQAQLNYQANLKLVYTILQSSTSSSSLRRKIAQYLISFSSFLIENRSFLKAQRILDLALQNCINLIAVLETKLKHSSKANSSTEKDPTFERFRKRTNTKLKQAFHFMMAIYLNSAVLFELQHKDHLAYLALNQARHIQQILVKNYAIKSKIQEMIKKPKQAFDYKHEQVHIVKCYFDINDILKRKQDERQMKFNQHVGVFGLAKASEMSLIQSKDLMELFFDEERAKKLRSQKLKMSIVASKIGLIEYDSPCSNKKYPDAIIQPTFKYTINMKSISGSQQTAVYSQVNPVQGEPVEVNKLSPELGIRRGRKKLSKFYNLAISEKDLTNRDSTNSKMEPNSINELKKSQKTYTTLKSQKMDQLQEKFQTTIQEIRTQDKEKDFLDKLIDSEVSIKNYFLYGRDFVDKYDLLSRGKTLYKKKDRENRSQNRKDYACESRKRIQYNRKDEIQVLGLKSAPVKDIKTSQNSGRLLKKSRPQSRQPFICISQNQCQKQPIHIVSNVKNKFKDQSGLKENQKQSNSKKRSSVSVKQEPMGYRQIMDKMEKIQNDTFKKDIAEKNGIYRLKCRSQNVSMSKLEISTDCLVKSTNARAMINAIKKENQPEKTLLKFYNSEKPGHFLKDEVKIGKLGKKTITSNIFSSSESGIRLLKKIIFKHKKALQITKPDLFVNYHKTQLQNQQIKLVDHQGLLMVQYEMCKQQTKARIKSNMKQLITENFRNSQQNQRRVQKLNKAISEYDKNSRTNEFGTKMRQEYDARMHLGNDKLMLTHNPHYFDHQLQKKGSNEDKKAAKAQQTDEILRTIFYKRILQSQTGHDPMVLGVNQNFLTGDKMKNPNLFLSSIKYKEEERGFKKMKTLKNLERGKESKVLDDSELQGTEQEEKKNAIERFLSFIQDDLSESSDVERLTRNGR